ncbi:M23 family metallopeptidase [Streptomyces sp. HNM0574]|uniref:M23 family metallopeptidase n=1 Tax=Streptomyces sp. HNM0574 TaxID=2714954 RepID=UPI00146CCDF2|nr:M23 family metallopeptidase [Streptomyces sp. HNM0574]NLU66476.1 M23 family metallopeptidase [Streptomyces sp. HNM0574]
MTATTRHAAQTARRIAAGTLTAALLVGGLTAASAAPAPAADRGRAALSNATERGADAAQALGPRQRAAAPSGGWARPVTGRYPVSQKYGIRGKWAAGHHTGVDLAVPSGTPVRSVGKGRVVFAGTSGDYGKAVTIRMADGKYTLFAHLSKIYVRAGAPVGAGTLIAKSGNTGRSSGPHLHFEVRAKRGYGSDIDPVAYLARKGVRLT